MITVTSINRIINTRPYKKDIKDEWKTPEEFKLEGGDCEDFAIAKYFELERQGHDITNTEIVYCEMNGEAHMVLCHNGRILDNITNEIKTLEERKDLKKIYSFNKEFVFMNGKIHKNNIVKWKDLLTRI